jgi:DNA-binding NarL/FixJ family response regulator
VLGLHKIFVLFNIFTNMAKILIVDDSSSIREFLKINLATETDIQIIGMADNGEGAIAKVKEYQPDLVLMDIEMPGKIDGIQATEIIVKNFSNTNVLLLTSQDDRQQLNLALKAGARGYILKNTDVKDIANIIRLTEKGFFQIGPILGNWDSSQHDSLKSETRLIATTSSLTTVGAVVQQNGNYAYETADVSAMNHVLSNLTSGIFQLQETIKSQEDTIINLTNQYSQVQQEIRTKLKKDKRVFSSARAFNYYGAKSLSSRFSQKRQHILFVISFFLGAFTVLFLLFLIMTLGGAL